LSSDGGKERNDIRVAQAPTGGEAGEMVAASLPHAPVDSVGGIPADCLVQRGQNGPRGGLEVHERVDPDSGQDCLSLLLRERNDIARASGRDVVSVLNALSRHAVTTRAQEREREREREKR